MSEDRQALSPVLRVTDLKVHFPVRRGLLQRQVDTVKGVDGVACGVKKCTTLGLVIAS